MSSESSDHDDVNPALQTSDPRSLRLHLRRSMRVALTLSLGAAVGIGTTIVAGSTASTQDGVATVADTAEDADVSVGLQDPQDPGPFPDSVVPTEDSITIAGDRDGPSTFDVVEYPERSEARRVG